MKHRMLRVNEVVKRELSGIVAREVSFEGALVTINHVNVNPDLKSAHVFVSVLGSEKAETVMTRLEEHRVAFQAELARRVTMKYTPHLLFISMNRSRAARVSSKFCNRSTATAKNPSERSQVRANRPGASRKSTVCGSWSCPPGWRRSREPARARPFPQKTRQRRSHLERRRHA